MNITVICIGKLKESYWALAIQEYSKRLGKYCLLTINELKEERAPSNPSAADESAIRAEEGRTIIKQIKPDMYVIACDLKGTQLSSEKMAEKINQLGISGKSHIAFIIGGSIGLSDEVLSRSDFKLSFSKMTFPHQLMRVILLEQIYRSFKINKNETYHK